MTYESELRTANRRIYEINREIATHREIATLIRERAGYEADIDEIRKQMTKEETNE